MNQTGELLKSLRQLMKNLPKNMGSIQAYVIPSDDAHQSEYIADHDQRRRFVSKFDGSAGTAVVTDTGAYLWTDGRYYQQASKQLDENWTLMKDGLPTTPTIDVWLARNMQAGTKVGVDPNLYSTRAYTLLKNTGCAIEPIAENLVDLVWPDQPAVPSNPVIPLDVKYAGRTIASKVAEIREQMRDKGTEVLVVSALDEVACESTPPQFLTRVF
jgi:Xaa-Pro aminopeptidase